MTLWKERAGQISFYLIPLLTGYWLICSLYANAQVLQGKSQSPGSDVRTTICEVVSDPVSFDGKTIEVHAAVLAGLETNLLYDKKCLEGKLPARILFVSDEQTFERTGNYRRFWNLVHAFKETNGRRRSITPDKYTVTATFIGRFNLVGTTGQLITSHGMLTVKSVRDVVARPFDDFLSATNPHSSERGTRGQTGDPGDGGTRGTGGPGDRRDVPHFFDYVAGGLDLT